jgi:hypothetical protein
VLKRKKKEKFVGKRGHVKEKEQKHCERKEKTIRKKGSSMMEGNREVHKYITNKITLLQPRKQFIK